MYDGTVHLAARVRHALVSHLKRLPERARESLLALKSRQKAAPIAHKYLTAGRGHQSLHHDILNHYAATLDTHQTVGELSTAIVRHDHASIVPDNFFSDNGWKLESRSFRPPEWEVIHSHHRKNLARKKKKKKNKRRRAATSSSKRARSS